MKLHITAQHNKLFTDQGYIGFENFPVDLLSIKKEIDKGKGAVRDLWRTSPLLQNIAVKKLGSIALQLTRRQSLYLACDEWKAASEPWDTSCAVQEHLSFQGLACIACLLFDEKNSCFFMHPSSWPGIIPYWPKERVDCFMVAYAGTEARYIVNTKDPHNHWLKKFGFGFGDSLQQNPMII